MRRGTNPTVTGSDSKSDGNSQHSVGSISDLPRDILVKILARLSVKKIYACKCVCKSWYDLISSPEFAMLHFDQAEVCPLVQSSSSLYLVQPEKHDFEFKLGMCDHTHSTSNVIVKLDSIFELPAPGRECSIVSSCNGLLLICIPNDQGNQHYVVCNPITGEYINLPEARKCDLNEDDAYFGFGFSATCNQYKVIRMVRRQGMKVEVHILGTESWKYIGSLTHSIYGSYSTYLNGFVYWCSKSISSIISFDVEKECFLSILVKGVDHPDLYENISIEGFGQELYVFGFLRSGTFHVWVTKDNGAEKELSHVFSIDMPYYKEEIKVPLRPIMYPNDGSWLMFNYYTESLIYLSSRSGVRDLNVPGIGWAVYAFGHIPSFVSLKHALSGHKVEVKVPSVRPRFTKLQRQIRDLYIVEYSDFYPESWELEWREP